MPAFADLFMTLHLVLLLGFVSVTALLMLVTLVNRWRVRGVLLSWRSGRRFQLPVWPTLFIGVVLAFLTYTVAADQALSPRLFAGYLVGGAFWFAAVLFSRSILVTECGLVDDVNRAHQGIAWGQVIDYFESSQGAHRTYAFFFEDDDGRRCRFELSVPPAHQDAFREVLAEKLDERFDLSMYEAYGKTALER